MRGDRPPGDGREDVPLAALVPFGVVRHHPVHHVLRVFGILDRSRRGCRQILKPHVLRLTALLSFERGEGFHVEAVARGIPVFEEAEPETLECRRCHGL